jgi:pimeloyl-ACP methyl ester carboxylesterase
MRLFATIHSIFSKLTIAALFTALSACTHMSPHDNTAMPPIIFVHGNGDTAGLWLTTLWRFESNGWPRERLFAMDVPYPQARDDDSKPQPTRSSTTEQMQALAAEVDKVRSATGADKVILIGNSRGGYAIRHYLQNGGGAKYVSHAILGGVPNHGVWASERNPASEFNGRGAFLTALNTAKNASGDEVTPGVKWLTLRSDYNDKYAQPDGAWIGQKGTPTNVSYDGPALKGALNLVLPGVDHRETSFSHQAFAETWKFLTGTAPLVATAQGYIATEPSLALNGKLTQLGLDGKGNDPTNVTLAGATMEVYEVDAATGARKGAALHRKTLKSNEMWGPFAAKAGAYYEFVVSAEGYATTHIYRSPFPRSTSVLNFRAMRLAEADKNAEAVFTMTRPRGYFTRGKDVLSLDAKLPPGVNEGVGGVSSSKLVLTNDAPRAVTAQCNAERITAAPWPAQQGHQSVMEFHY